MPGPVGLSTAAAGWSWSPPGTPAGLRVGQHEPGSAELARALPELGIAAEAGLWTALSAHRLADEYLARLCLRVLVEPQEAAPAAALVTIAAVDAVLDEAAIDLQRVYHGRDATAWPVIDAMLARGRDVRVGLEDVLTLPDGRPARDNTELVEVALALARASVK